MKYMGSKSRHAKEILPIILKDRKPNQFYVEPFCGGCNTLDKVDNPRIGSDIHPHLMTMWQAVSNGWTPPKFVSEEDYKKAQLTKELTPEVGYIGFALSFGGKWFGGYRRDKAGIKNYHEEVLKNSQIQSNRSFKNSLIQFPKLLGVEFICCSYTELKIPKNSIIYCDPPYEGTTKYATSKFDHKEFWNWCNDKYQEGHTVFVSEYNAPKDWKCVWEKKVNSSLTLDTGSKQNIERLFTK